MSANPSNNASFATRSPTTPPTLFKELLDKILASSRVFKKFFEKER